VKKLIVCLLSLLLVLSFTIGITTSCGGAKPTGPVELRLSTTLPPDQEKLLEDMAASFNQRAAGSNYSMKVYPNGELASMEESFDMVRTGGVDLSEIGLSAAMAEDVRLGAGGLPFVINNIDASVKFVKLIDDSLFNDIMEKDFNQKILAAWPSPTLYYCGIKPVKTLEDWKGLLIHTMTPIQTDAVKALGGSPVSMAFMDVVPSLEKGVIDGGVNLNAYVISAFNWYDSFKYLTVCGMFNGHILLDMNLDVWNAMPNDIQKILIDECSKLEQNFINYIIEGEKTAAGECASHGIDVYNLPAAEQARWKQATSSVVDSFFAQLDSKDVKKIQDALTEANK
jgi:TRAP-type C4-dicarboxylate transport system substrate-binding protein